jgi:hypothetical protein
MSLSSLTAWSKPMSNTPDAGIWRVITLVSVLIPAGVLTLAVLAGQGWFVDATAFTWHAALGHMVTLLAALTATFLWLLKAYRYALLATVQAILLVTQTGLGYAGRRGGLAVASSLHVPVGVATFGLGLVLALWLMQHRKEQRFTARNPQE